MSKFKPINKLPEDQLAWLYNKETKTIVIGFWSSIQECFWIQEDEFEAMNNNIVCPCGPTELEFTHFSLLPELPN